MNTEESARADFAAKLAAAGLGDLGPLLGQLAIHTEENLANLTESEWSSTLELIPAKRPGELADLGDAARYAPGHFALLRQLREAKTTIALTGSSAQLQPQRSGTELQEGGYISDFPDHRTEAQVQADLLRTITADDNPPELQEGGAGVHEQPDRQGLDRAAEITATQAASTARPCGGEGPRAGGGVLRVFIQRMARRAGPPGPGEREDEPLTLRERGDCRLRPDRNQPVKTAPHCRGLPCEVPGAGGRRGGGACRP
jgi:hypothetical protein